MSRSELMGADPTACAYARRTWVIGKRDFIHHRLMEVTADVTELVAKSFMHTTPSGRWRWWCIDLLPAHAQDLAGCGRSA